MNIVSLDVETTGLHPEVADLLSIGIIVFDSEPSTFIIKEQAEFVIKHDFLRGHPKAFIMNQALLAKCLEPGAQPLSVVSHLLHELLSPYRRFTFAGKNFAGFDLTFLEAHIPYWSNITQLAHHRTLDPGSMFVRSTDPVPPHLAECCLRAGVPYDAAFAHSAIYDALLVARCIHAFLHPQIDDMK